MASSMARLTSVEWSGGGVVHARENMKWRPEETALTGIPYLDSPETSASIEVLLSGICKLELEGR
uniref:Uncharacterized protein n=1 Tax=Oryza rufipogon TaxID=4529 RepID=A0A0E0P5C0_ORYRU